MAVEPPCPWCRIYETGKKEKGGVDLKEVRNLFPCLAYVVGPPRKQGKEEGAKWEEKREGVGYRKGERG